MIAYPQIDPILVQVGPIAVRWYGLMYLLSFAIGWHLLQKRSQRVPPHLSEEVLADLLVWILFGVILGGRVGYTVFYHASYYLEHPLAILRIWEGGMSFHGGALGVLFAGWLFARRQKISYLALADMAIPVFPIGLGLGRIGNFINGELWGAPTDLPWAMVFPLAGPLPRHPSQLYEFALEGVLLGMILWWLGRVVRPPGFLLGVFLVVYAFCRFAVEFVREPDAHLGVLSLGMTMGQWLSVPMVFIGAYLMISARKRVG